VSFYTRFAPHYERIFPFRPTTLAFLQRHLPPRGAVLDLGCGPGHYAGALAASGLEAIGLDRDGAMIEAARRRYPDARFVAADLGEVGSIGLHADGAFCIGNVLPHLSPGRLAALLADLAVVLPPGAPWVVQTVNFDRLLHDLPAIEAGDGLVFRRRYVPGADGGLLFVTALERGAETVFSGETRLWPLTSADLAAAHAAAGFDLAARHGTFAGDAFDPAVSPGCIQVHRRLA